MELEIKNNKRLSKILEKCKAEKYKMIIIVYYQSLFRHLLMYC